MLLVRGGADPGSLLAGRLPMPEFPHNSTLHKIQQRGVLRVGVVADAPGFSQLDPKTGRFKGLDISVSRRLAQSIFGGSAFQAEKHLQFIEISLAERVTGLLEDRVDIVASVFSITQERMEVIDFTSPYFGAALTLIVNKDSRITDVTDLHKGSVALVESTVEADLVHSQHLTSTIIESESNNETVKAVSEGRADAFLMCKTLYDGFDPTIRAGLRRLPAAIQNNSFGVGVAKDKQDLRDFLDVNLNEMISSGFIALADAVRRRNLQV